MVQYILFMDYIRQQEIDTFFQIPYILGQDLKMFIHRVESLIEIKMLLFLTFLNNYFDIQACQKHRNYYKGVPQNYHPLKYFEEREYRWQCPSEMTTSYLTYPYYHVRYKQPSVLPHSTGRTSGIPALPERTLAARFNKPSCKAYIR